MFSSPWCVCVCLLSNKFNIQFKSRESNLDTPLLGHISYTHSTRLRLLASWLSDELSRCLGYKICTSALPTPTPF